MCALHFQLANTKESAAAVWHEETYFDTSLPVSDLSAHKWQIKDALLACNTKMTYEAPEVPHNGLFEAVLGKHETKSKRERKHLDACLPADDDESYFFVYDQAVEIDLAWEADRDKARAIVRDAWQVLEMLAQFSLNTIYDAERDVLLDLDADFDAVLEHYLKSAGKSVVEAEAAQDKAEVAAAIDMAMPHVAPKAGEAQPASAQQGSDGSFAGNAGDTKPWWKPW
jgi:hypothetical protein